MSIFIAIIAFILFIKLYWMLYKQYQREKLNETLQELYDES